MWRLWPLVVLSLTACEVGTPLPRVQEDVERLDGVKFGLTASAVLARRPDGAFDEQGVYREFLDLSTQVNYGFLPWEDRRRPDPQARLQGVEIREEMADSVQMRAAWNARFRRIDARSTRRARCTRIDAYRFDLVQAAFPDTVRITLTAEIVEGGDGRAYQAYLSTRMDTPAMVEFVEEHGGYGAREGGIREAIPCPSGTAPKRPDEGRPPGDPVG